MEFLDCFEVSDPATRGETRNSFLRQKLQKRAFPPLSGAKLHPFGQASLGLPPHQRRALRFLAQMPYSLPKPRWARIIIRCGTPRTLMCFQGNGAVGAVPQDAPVGAVPQDAPVGAVPQGCPWGCEGPKGLIFSVTCKSAKDLQKRVDAKSQEG